MTDVDIDELFAPAGLSSFLVNEFGRMPFHVKGEAQRFESLFGWDAVNYLLTYSRWQYPRFRLAKDGQDLPVGEYSGVGPSGDDYRLLDFRDLRTALASGASLVMDAVDELWPPVRRLAENLEARLREYVKVNVYASWTSEPGFDQHWDDHDVVVLQLAGSKRWLVYGAGREWPMRRDVEPNLRAPDRAPDEYVVNAGDILHVPRGHWHTVRALTSPSLHLTIGVTQRTGLDYLHWLVDQLIHLPLVRESLPRYSADALVDRQDMLVRALIDAERSAGSIADFLSHGDATAAVRQCVQLPDVVTGMNGRVSEDANVRWNVPRATVAVDGASCVVAGNGKRWIFKPVVAPVLTLLVDAVDVPVARLVRDAGVDRDIACAVIADLVREGLVTLA